MLLHGAGGGSRLRGLLQSLRCAVCGLAAHAHGVCRICLQRRVSAKPEWDWRPETPGQAGAETDGALDGCLQLPSHPEA